MSEVKVNKISPRTACGTTTLGDSGDTIAIPAGVASTIEGNVTLGSSGKTITIPAGATITNSGTAAGFGATGAASWDTTVKTSGFTAVSGVGYFCNTTSGGFSVNLPAGTAGAVVAIKDYAGTFDTGTLTLVQNGSDKIGGSIVNATLTTEGIAVTLVFIDSTQGWLVTDSGLQDEAPTSKYVTATGGTITCSGDYRIHTFTGPGALCVSCAGNAAGSNTVEYLIVAGGGGGGKGCSHGSGAGAGGYRVSPAVPISVTSFPIVVGAGGAGAPATPRFPGGDGNTSSFNSIASTGGGGGVGWSTCAGRPGGSGSGAACSPNFNNFGAGNTPPVSPPQGNPGGSVTNAGNAMGGGGGAGEAGNTDGDRTGGDGISNSITGSAVFYAGGGSAGGSNPSADMPGGQGGGGIGGGPPSTPGGAGTANTGGGGGGSFSSQVGGAGGSGIVIIKYKFQN